MGSTIIPRGPSPSSPVPSFRNFPRYSSTRLRVVLIAPVLILAALTTFVYDVESLKKLSSYYGSILRPSCPDSERPPEYSQLRQWEAGLPQHNVDLPFPEGGTGRYVLFSNSRHNPSGWNNKLNDMLMNTWLAHSSNRAYVFHDFTWVDSHYPWPVSSYREWTPRTPLNALVAGPSAGGPWEEGDSAPRSVSEPFFDLVCPKKSRKIINTRDVKPALREADGQEIFERWRTILTETPDRCVEIIAALPEEEPFPETFDILYWSGARSISIWDDFLRSPVSRLLKASHIVQGAILDNIQLFTSQQPTSRTTGDRGEDQTILISDTFRSIFSIHVRRGDFQQACIEHAQINSTFYNWNLLPFLPDRLSAISGEDESQQQILDHCWPSAEAIRAKVNLARREYDDALPEGMKGGPRVMYIMSNDRKDWIRQLKRSFESDGWDRVIMSRDLVLSPQQKDVSVAVDMEIGKISEVFIGNGWSSFTSNVIHQRLADKKAPISIRFW